MKRKTYAYVRMRTHARPNFLEMEKDEQNYESGQYRARARDHRYHGYLAERLVVFMAFVFFFGAFLAFMVFIFLFLPFALLRMPSGLPSSLQIGGSATSNVA